MKCALFSLSSFGLHADVRGGRLQAVSEVFAELGHEVLLPVSDFLQSSEDRRAADSLVRLTRSTDSLSLLQKRLEHRGDALGSIVALREWGKALNNIGTDYWRMGVLDVAQEYHYSAWKLSEACTDTSFAARKNRVVSLNGLGNIYLSLGNYVRADSALRMALAGERQLGSALGQAINYANLGFIFEHDGKMDSAWAYYRRSMTLNTEIHNELGISLCHTYFGSLYEKARQYDKATEEYETAYRLMQESKDEWHALNSLIALAGIHHATGNGARFLEYLSKARGIADRIGSKVHLAEIHTLYYKYYKQTGDCHSVLAAHEQATALQDSVLDMEKVNRIQNTGLRIERNRQAMEMDESRRRLEQERTVRYIGFVVLGGVLLVLAVLLAMMSYTGRLRKRSHQALKRMAELREHFFTHITQEFRTPLTVILGLSQRLQYNESAEVRQAAQSVERQGNGLLNLINQLLDISKIKSGLGNPDWRGDNIIAYMAMIVESYQDYAKSRHINLLFFSKDEVVMDFVPDYVTKVLNNLLSNALKFTPEYGSVGVMVRREDSRLLIDVSDTGCGMDPDTLRHVFEPFYQGDGVYRSVGTGVGLTLVKQIMDAVNGQITVESTVGKGTTFHMSVPIRNEIKHTTEIPEPEHESQRGSRSVRLQRVLQLCAFLQECPGHHTYGI